MQQIVVVGRQASRQTMRQVGKTKVPGTEVFKHVLHIQRQTLGTLDNRANYRILNLPIPTIVHERAFSQSMARNSYLSRPLPSISMARISSAVIGGSPPSK